MKKSLSTIYYASRANYVAFLCSLIMVLSMTFAQNVNAQVLSDLPCYAIAEQSAPNYFLEYDPATMTWNNIGITGTGSIEAMATDPLNGIIYATDGGTLGTIDPTSGTFTAIGSAGIAEGVQYGPLDMTDLDGLSYDPVRMVLWASHRIPDGGGSMNNDLLLQIDPATGLVIPDAFGPGIDYVSVEQVFDGSLMMDVYDVDDIAFSPFTGELYVISNQGGVGGVLTIIDEMTGMVESVVGDFPIDDMEGLGFSYYGELYGTTGNNGPVDADRNNFYFIDPTTGMTTILAPIDPTGVAIDIESFDCFTGFIDLALDKVISPTQVTPILEGDMVTFDITVYNQGGLPVENVTVTDYVPAGLTLADAAWSPDAAGVNVEQVIPGPIAIGGSETISITFTVDAGFNGTSIENIAEISEANDQFFFDLPDIDSVPDNDPTNEENTVDNQIDGGGISVMEDEDDHDPETIFIDFFDLALVKTVDPAQASPIAPGDDVTFLIDVINQGTIDATNVEVTDYIPAGFTLSANDANGWTDNGTTATQTIASIAGGTTETLQIVLTVDPASTGGDLINVAEISAAEGGDDVDSTPDADPANDAGGAADTASDDAVDGDGSGAPGDTDAATDEDDADPALINVFVEAIPAIQITKTAGDAADGAVYTINAAGLVTFTYEIENTGTTFLSDITITDDAGTPADPADDVTLTSAECPDLAGPLAPGGIVTCTADIQVDGDAINMAGTTGTPTDENGDPLPDLTPPTDEDDAEVVLEILLVPAIQIIKTAGDAADGAVYTINAAGLVTFTYEIENTGETFLTDVTITDDAGTPADPADDVTITSAECPSLAGPLAPGDIVTCTADIQVDADATNIAGTTGTPTDENGDPLPGVDPPTDDDDAEVVIVPLVPGIQIIKTAGMAADGADLEIDSPQDVVYTYEITNTGETYLTDITITDDAGTPADAADDVTITSVECADLAGPLAPAGVVVCTATFSIADDVTNNAGTTGTPTDENGDPIPGVDPPTDEDDAVVLYVPGVPAIQIIKTAGMAADGANLEIDAPQDVVYTFEITNTGTTYLTNVIIMDDAGTPADAADDVTITSMTCAGLAGPLAPGDVVTCTATFFVDGDLTNNAGTTGTPTDEDGNPLPGVDPPMDEDDAIVLYVPGVPAIEIIKTAGMAADGATMEIDAPQDVVYTFDVTNTGTTYLTDVVITDNAGTPADPADDVTITSAECPGLAGPLAPGDMVTCTATFFVDGDLTNTAGVTGTPTDENGNPLPGVDPPTDEDDAIVLYVPGVPAIEIIKTAGMAADGATMEIDAPQDVVYTFDVTNTGTTYLTDVVITDNAGTPADPADDVTITSAECPGLAGPLAPGDVVTCTATFFVDGDLTNTAGVTGTPTDENGNPLPGVDPPTDEDDAIVLYVPGVPGIEIIKTAGMTADGANMEIDAPQDVVYTFDVTNTGETFLTNVTITDDAGTPANPADDVTITSAECPGLAGPLAPGDVVTCTATFFVDGDLTNSAGVTGTPTDENGNPLPGVLPPTDEDEAIVLYVPGVPGIEIIKTAGMAADGGTLMIDEPELITYTFLVNNTGETFLTNVVIMDDAGTPADVSDDIAITAAQCSDLAGPIAPGGSVTCTLDLMVNGSLTNSAGVTGTPTDENGNPLPGVLPPTDEDEAVVLYAPGTPAIQIVKTASTAADNTNFTIDQPSLVTFFFEVSNIGTTNLSNATITDDAGTPNDPSDDIFITAAECPGLANTILPGQSVTCSIDLFIDGSSFTFTNSASTTATPTGPSGYPLPGVIIPTDEDDAVVIYAPGVPGISIAKTAGEAINGTNLDLYQPQLVLFTFTVQNTGTTYLSDILITDDAGTPNDPSDDIPLDASVCADLAGPLAPGGIVTCTLEMFVSETMTNGAGATGMPTTETGDPLPGTLPPTSVDPATVNVFDLDLALIITLAPGQSPNVFPGDDVTFTITVFNQGASDVQNIDIINYLPPELLLNDPNWNVVNGFPVITLPGSIPPGGSTTIDITTTVTTLNLGDIINSAEVVSGQDPNGVIYFDVDSSPDDDPTNDGAVLDNEINNVGGDEDDSDPVLITVIEDLIFDLALEKDLAAGQPENVMAGDDVRFTITIENQGMVSATNVQITEYIPANFSLSANDNNGWFVVGSNALNSIVGPIQPGQIEMIDIILTVDPNFLEGLLVNVAEISSFFDENGNEVDDNDSTPDMDPFNDDINEDDIDDAPVAVTMDDPVFDLALLKSLGAGQAMSTAEGSEVLFTISVYNEGELAASNISIVDYLPAELTLSPNDTNGWVQSGTNITNFIAGPIAPNGEASIDVLLVVGDVETNTQIVNTAEITFALDPDNNPGDDTDSVADNDPNNDLIAEDDIDTEILIIPDCEEPFICDDLEICLEPLEEIVICPDWCLPGTWTILEAESLFECSLEYLDDCVGYIPLPGLTFDVLTLFAQNELGECAEISYAITIGDCNPNNPPIITTPPTDFCGAPQVGMTICVDAYDPDGDNVEICDLDVLSDCNINIINGLCFVYVPLPEQTGTDVITVTVCDDGEPILTDMVELTVTVGCNAPIAVNDVLTITETGATFNNNNVTVTNGVVDLNAIANDQSTDACFPDIELTQITAQPENGTAMIVNGEIQYQPNADFNGDDLIQYEICNECGACDQGIISINVDVEICESVLETCTEPITEVEICVEFCNITNASVVSVETLFDCAINLINDDCFTYIPLPGLTGIDSLTVMGMDANGNTDIAIVYVDVEGCEPLFLNDDSASTLEDESVTINVLSNDNGMQEFTCPEIYEAPANGEVVVNLDGSVSYLPSMEYSGFDSFTYRICNSNNNDCDEALVVVEVIEVMDYLPNLQADENVAYQGVETSIDVLINDMDPNGDDLLLIWNTEALNGTASIYANELVYTSNSDFLGLEEITYVACDTDGNCETQNVTIEVVENVNQAPYFVDNAANQIEQIYINVGTSQTHTECINVFDADGDELEISLSQTAFVGQTTLINNCITYTAPAVEGMQETVVEVCDENGACSTITVVFNVLKTVAVNELADNSFEIVSAVQYNNQVLINYNYQSNSEIEYALYDVSGKVIKNGLSQATAGNNQLVIEDVYLANAMYVVNLNNGKVQVSIKLLAQE